MQHYVLLILRHSRLARKTRECRKISNLIQHSRKVAKAQHYNSSKFRLKMLLKIRSRYFSKKNNCIYSYYVLFQDLAKRVSASEDWVSLGTSPDFDAMYQQTRSYKSAPTRGMVSGLHRSGDAPVADRRPPGPTRSAAN